MAEYSISVNWSEEDGCFVALIPEFPNLSAFGETRAEAIAEAEVALGGFVEVYKEEGYKLPKANHLQSDSGQIRLRMPKGLHSKLSQEAERQGVSLNTYIVSSLSESLPLDRVMDRLDEINSRVIGGLFMKTPQVQPSTTGSIVRFEPIQGAKTFDQLDIP
ncbi:MAG: type II toxin-antitoxin system HicB family antitoxin [Deltaproteobacteria bacterium]|nr:type II toxin-antitoxin system HicB family antitoxin [Deltaproteobacteria bacterium]